MPIAYAVLHEEQCPPGLIGWAAEERGYELVDVASFIDGDHTLPDPSGADIILVTGSTAHWYDLSAEPQLQRELEFLQRAVAQDVPILGMCFGGQGLALALGGEITKSAHFEAGWVDVQTADDALIPTGPWFEMHHDQFSLPAGAELLAWNDVCPQAFRFGPHLGLQFHAEIHYDMLALWESSLASYDGLDVDELLRQTKHQETGARHRALALFDTFLSWGGPE